MNIESQFSLAIAVDEEWKWGEGLYLTDQLKLFLNILNLVCK